MKVGDEKKVFLYILLISQENTYARGIFKNEVACRRPAAL